MNAWAPALLLGVLALAIEALAPMLQRRAPGWGQALLEGGAPLAYGLLPLWVALRFGWLSLREVGLSGPLRLAPGTLLGWSAADWVRGVGLAGLYGGITLLALWSARLWRPRAVQWIERAEGAFQALAREGLQALWRGVLTAAAFPMDPVPTAWAAFGLWWSVRWGIGRLEGTRPTPALWGGELAATALFGITGNLWLSAAVHALIAGLLAGPEAASSSLPASSRTANTPHRRHGPSATDHS